MKKMKISAGFLLVATGIVLVSLILLVRHRVVSQKELPVLGPPGHSIPDFSLIDHSGKTVKSQELKGKVLICDFFFTRCPTICPILTRTMQKIAEKIPEKGDIWLLSFTVDPLHDTPSVLRKYRERYGIAQDNWLFLTGPKDTIYWLARKGFLVAVDEGDEPASFIHTDKIVLVDKHLRIRGYYTGTDSTIVEDVVKDALYLAGKIEE